ncbi:MAG: DUF898 domain-containing protein [Hyphomicrobiaceae bacterium]
MAAHFDGPRRHQTRHPDRLSIDWQFPPGLIDLSVINFLFRVTTLGIYHFWAKTEVRQRLWSAIRINDEPLTYTGRGMELFLGFVIVVGAVFLPAILLITGLSIAFGPRHPVTNVGILLFYACFFFLFGLAVYRAQRYRLSRTRWRGIRFALEGDGLTYAWTFACTAILIPFTFGWIQPWRATKLQSMITNHTKFGDQYCDFDAKSGPLYGPFALAWIGGLAVYIGFISLVTALYFNKLQLQKVANVPFVPSAWEVGVTFAALIVAGFVSALATAWYRARMINHFADHTRIGKARFDGNLDAIGVIWISVTNYLIMIAGMLCVGILILAIALPTIQLQGGTSGDGNPVGKLVLYLIPIMFVLGPMLFSPITQARSTGYIVANLSARGNLAMNEITQATGSDVKYGEGLAETFDIDVA